MTLIKKNFQNLSVYIRVISDAELNVSFNLRVSLSITLKIVLFILQLIQFYNPSRILEYRYSRNCVCMYVQDIYKFLPDQSVECEFF